MCGSYVLQATRSKCNNTQINSKCLLCGNAEETVVHYILTRETLEKFRNPILTKISETYLNLTGKEYRILDTRSKLQIIIACSVLLSQERKLNKRLKIQDLASLEFHARRFTHVLHTNRYRFLNHPIRQSKQVRGHLCMYISCHCIYQSTKLSRVWTFYRQLPFNNVLTMFLIMNF